MRSTAAKQKSACKGWGCYCAIKHATNQPEIVMIKFRMQDNMKMINKRTFLCIGVSLAATRAHALDTAAMDVALSMRDAGIPIMRPYNVTAETDSNRLLGRPGYYTSKVMFGDRRYNMPELRVYPEGTIEIFPTPALALRRSNYIKRVTRDLPRFQQYHTLVGRGLLRLDFDFSPDDAAAYAAAFRQAMR